MNLVKKNYDSPIAAIIAWALLLFLSHIAVTKLQNTEAFQFEFSLSPLLRGQALFLSYFVPLLETVAVALLLFRKVRFWGFVLTGSLGLINIVGMYFVTERFPHFRGGLLYRLTFQDHLIVNIAVLALSVAGLLLVKGVLVRAGRRDLQTSIPY